MNFQLQPSPVFNKSPVVRVNKTLTCVLCPAPLLLLQKHKMATSAAASSMLSTGMSRSYNKLRLLKKKKKKQVQRICRNLHTHTSHTWILRKTEQKCTSKTANLIERFLNVTVLTSKSWFEISLFM